MVFVHFPHLWCIEGSVLDANGACKILWRRMRGEEHRTCTQQAKTIAIPVSQHCSKHPQLCLLPSLSFDLWSSVWVQNENGYHNSYNGIVNGKVADKIFQLPLLFCSYHDLNISTVFFLYSPLNFTIYYKIKRVTIFWFWNVLDRRRLA